MHLSKAYLLPGWREYEECIVDAENPAELLSCSDQSDPKPRKVPPLEAMMAQVGAFFARLGHVDIKVEDVHQCIVDAESADERAACVA